MDLRRLLFLLPAFIFVGVGIGLAVGLTRDPSTLPSALIDKRVPAFELPPLAGRDGPSFSSADLGGHVSLVNVFASWCVPCRIEHPLLMALADDGAAVRRATTSASTRSATGSRTPLPASRIGVGLPPATPDAETCSCPQSASPPRCCSDCDSES